MDFISKLCDPVICMAEGKVLAQGTIEEIKDNESVIEAYLGTGMKNKIKAGNKQMLRIGNIVGWPNIGKSHE